jgi:tetratricopeptide (TPR) repeat protein
MKNHSLAVRDLDAAFQMDNSVSNAMQIHRNRALSYAQLGNASFAIDDLNKLVQLQTRRDFVEPEAFFLRAMCFALQHQHILAIKDFDRAFEANAKLKKHPRTDPVTGKVYKFSGSLEVRIEQQRVAVQNTLRGTSTMPARQQMGSEERSEQMRSVLDGHYRDMAAGVLSEESRAAGWRVAHSPDDLPKGELPQSTGERPSSEQVAAREAEIANILQQHYAPKTEL